MSAPAEAQVRHRDGTIYKAVAVDYLGGHVRIRGQRLRRHVRELVPSEPLRDYSWPASHVVRVRWAVQR